MLPNTGSKKKKKNEEKERLRFFNGKESDVTGCYAGTLFCMFLYRLIQDCCHVDLFEVE